MSVLDQLDLMHWDCSEAEHHDSSRWRRKLLTFLWLGSKRETRGRASIPSEDIFPVMSFFPLRPCLLKVLHSTKIVALESKPLIHGSWGTVQNQTTAGGPLEEVYHGLCHSQTSRVRPWKTARRWRNKDKTQKAGIRWSPHTRCKERDRSTNTVHLRKWMSPIV